MNMEAFTNDRGILLTKGDMLRIADLLIHYSNLLELNQTAGNNKLRLDALEFAERLKSFWGLSK